MAWRTRIVEGLGGIIRRLHREAPPSPPSPLRLDEAIPARSPLEDLPGGLRVVEEAVDSRLLRPRRVPGPPGGDGRIYFAVDSSARSIELPSASIVVASVAVSSSHAPVLAWWPGASSRPLPGVEEPFILVLPNTGGVEVEDWPATSRNPAGDPYGPDYSLAQAMDEARVRLENAALHALARLIDGAGLDAPVVLVDGPLYPVTGALVNPGVPGAYRRAWERLLADRVRAVEALMRAGAVVVGVVKRIENSRLLSRAPRLGPVASRCLGGRQSYTDKMALYYAMRRPCLRGVPGRIYATPVLVVDGLAGKRAQYLVIPYSRHLHGPGAARYYRVEAPAGTRYEPALPVAADSAGRGSVAPVTVSVADRAAKAEAQALQALALRHALSRDIPVGYSSMVEAVASGALW